jgi:hypothetical protein
MATARQSIPFVVPPQVVPAPEVISQTELAMFISLRGRLHQLETQVESAEQSIRERLEHGALVEQGDHIATLEEHFRRNVSWKDVVLRLAERLRMDGAMYCARVLAAKKPTRSVSLTIS